MKAVELGIYDTVTHQADIIRNLRERCQDLTQALENLLDPGPGYGEVTARVQARRLLGGTSGRERTTNPDSMAKVKQRAKK